MLREKSILQEVQPQRKKNTTEPGAGRYYKESGISDEAQKEIVSILMREKRKNAARRTQEDV